MTSKRIRSGSIAANADSYIGMFGDLFYDPLSSVLRCSDGVTPGGVIMTGGNSSSSPAFVAPTFSDQTQTRTNLGLGSIATQNANAVAITGGTLTGVNVGSTVSTPTSANPMAIS